MSKIFVLASSANAAYRFMREKGINGTYIGGVYMLYSENDFIVYKIGNYYQRHDYHDIDREIRDRGCNQVIIIE